MPANGTEEAVKLETYLLKIWLIVFSKKIPIASNLPVILMRSVRGIWIISIYTERGFHKPGKISRASRNIPLNKKKTKSNRNLVY